MSRTSRTPGLSAFSLPPPSSSSLSASTPPQLQSANASPSPRPTLTPNQSSNPRAPLYATHGTALRASHVDALQTQLSVFRSLLHNFALTHADRIRADASFRSEFVRMCRAVGVDADAGEFETVVTSNSNTPKGIGAGAASWVGSLISGSGATGGEAARKERRNAEITVRVVEACRDRRGIDGGLTPMDTLVESVKIGAGRGVSSVGRSLLASGKSQEQPTEQKLQARPLLGGEIQDVGQEDIERAITSLAPLNSGYALVELPGGKETLVRSVPGALSNDQAVVLECIQALGWVTCSLLEDNLGWTRARAETVCLDLVSSGWVWVDEQGEGGSRDKEYWGTADLGSWED